MKFDDLIQMLSTASPVLSFESALGAFFPKAGEVLGAVCGQVCIGSGTPADQDWPVVFEWESSADTDRAGEAVNRLKKLSPQASGIEMHSISVNGVDVPAKDQALPDHRLVYIPVSCKDRLAGYLLFIVLSEASCRSIEERAEQILFMLSLWLKVWEKEKRFQDLVDFIPNPLMMLGKDETVTVWNPAMEKMSGIPAEKMIGKGGYAHAVPFYQERRPTSSNLILHPDDTWEDRYLEMKRDGDVMHALARTDALPNGPILIASKTGKNYDIAGHGEGSVHMIQDVTHEHELKKSLSRAEKMYQGISEFAGVGIALLDMEWIHSANDTFSDLIELPGNSKRAMAIFDKIVLNSSEDIETLFEHMLETKADPVSFEFVSFLSKKGRRDFQAYVQGVKVDNRQVLHLVIIDITESKEMERRKNLYQMRMYHGDRLTALGTLSAGIAHELNQPLNAIRVAADGLLFGREQGWKLDEEEVYENARIISRQTVKMSGVIKNVRNFARDDKARDYRQINLNDSVRNVFSMIGQQLKAHGIYLDRSLEKNLPRVLTHQNYFEQVVMNLVVNAQQALDSIGKRGSVQKKEKKIWVKTGYRFSQVFLEVGDNGPGISNAHVKQVFDPFFTTKEVGQGTGLGLSISQTIVLELGGEINVYNNSLGGATFFMTLPVEA